MASSGNDKKTVLIISQTFVPDPASVGQHMADVAQEMARRGHRVVVYAANRGYENPSIKYAGKENLNGVIVRRLPFSSFGKKNIFRRALGTLTFMIQAIVVTLTTRRLAGVFFSTSPPLIGFAAALAKIIRGVPIVYWAMDLNPDQLIAMGKIKPNGFMADALERVNRFFLRHSRLVVALDRFMAERLRRRGVPDDRMLVLPPWSHEDHMQAPSRDANPFRITHQLGGKFIVMYSGNHSPANPLETLLAAATRLKNNDQIRFLFVGGGLGKRAVEAAIREQGLTNVLSLPYQPLAELGNSLGAADIHVVSLGDGMVGIIHPCKIYGAMAVSRPVLYFGPSPSHVSDLLEHHQIGWHIAHGDVDRAVSVILAAAAANPAELHAMGERAHEVVSHGMNQARLCARLCDHLELVFRETHGAGSNQVLLPPT